MAEVSGFCLRGHNRLATPPKIEIFSEPKISKLVFVEKIVLKCLKRIQFWARIVEKLLFCPINP